MPQDHYSSNIIVQTFERNNRTMANNGLRVPYQEYTASKGCHNEIVCDGKLFSHRAVRDSSPLAPRSPLLFPFDKYRFVGNGAILFVSSSYVLFVFDYFMEVYFVGD